MTADKTVTVRLQAVVSDYQSKMGAAAAQTAVLEKQVASSTAATTSLGASQVAVAKTTEQLGKQVQTTAGATAAWGQQASALGGVLNRTVLPAAIAVALAIKGYQDGEDALRAGTGATGAQLDQLADSMANVGAVAPESLGQIGSTMATLYTRTGQTGAGLELLTQQMVELGRLGSDAKVNTVTRVFGDWSISTDRQSAALDTLYKISELTGTSVEKISSGVVKFGAPLREAGYSFQQAAELIAGFEKAGVNTDQVMAGLRLSLARFAAAGKEPRQALANVIEQIQELGPSAAATTLAVDTFGRRAGLDMARAITEGRFSLKDLDAQLAKNHDSITAAAGDTMHLGDQLAILRNKAAAALGPAGDTGLAIAGMAAAAGPALVAFGNISTKLDSMGTSLTSTAIKGAAVGGIVAGAAVAWSTYADAVATADRESQKIRTDAFAKYLGKDDAAALDQRKRLAEQLAAVNREIAENSDLPAGAKALGAIPGAGTFAMGLVGLYQKEQKDQAEALRTQLQGLTDDEQKFELQVSAFAMASGMGTDAVRKWLTEQAKAGHTYDSAVQALHAYRIAMGQATDSTGQFADETQQAAEATANITSAAMGAVDAETALHDSIAKIADAREAEVKAAGRVFDAMRSARKAEEAITDARRNDAKALEAIADAEQARIDALAKVQKATQNVEAAQQALNAALAGPTDDEKLTSREAALRVEEARAKIATDAAKLRKAQGDGSGQDITKAQLDLKGDQLDLDKALAAQRKADGAQADDITKAQADLVKAQEAEVSAKKDAAKASTAVQDAQEAERKAAEGITDAQYAAQKAHEAVADAQRDAGKAAEAVGKAQTDAARKAWDAQAAQEALNTALSDNPALAQASLDQLEKLKAKYPELAAAIDPYIAKLLIARGLEASTGLGGIVGSAIGVSEMTPNQVGALSTTMQALANIGTAYKNEHAPGRAFGGPVEAGRMYKVNERSIAEMYTDQLGAQYMLPTTSGKVTPLPAGAGGSRSMRYEPHYHLPDGDGITWNQLETAKMLDAIRLSSLAG